MVETLDIGYKCDICGIIHEKRDDAIKCEQDHDVIYVPFNREDLFKLIQFLMTKDEKLLSKSLLSTLYKYRKGYYR
jgi:hypothetical protein